MGKKAGGRGQHLRENNKNKYAPTQHQGCNTDKAASDSSFFLAPKFKFFWEWRSCRIVSVDLFAGLVHAL